jgi:flagellar basal body-associated protein FliL
MADKEEKKDKKAEASAEKHDDKKPSGGLLSKTPVLIGGIMLVEAVVLFAGFKFLMGGGPTVATGAELVEEGHDAPADDKHGGGGHGASSGSTDKSRVVEVPLLEMRATNKRDGRTFLYQVKIVVATRAANEEKVKALIKEREALIRDRVRTIIAQSDPDRLGGGKEPGLETLRRQVKHQLDEIVGEGVIDEVLVPDCIPFRTDF